MWIRSCLFLFVLIWAVGNKKHAWTLIASNSMRPVALNVNECQHAVSWFYGIVNCRFHLLFHVKYSGQCKSWHWCCFVFEQQDQYRIIKLLFNQRSQCHCSNVALGFSWHIALYDFSIKITKKHAIDIRLCFSLAASASLLTDKREMCKSRWLPHPIFCPQKKVIALNIRVYLTGNIPCLFIMAHFPFCSRRQD